MARCGPATDGERPGRRGRAVEDSERRLRAIMDSTIDGIVTIDQDGLICSFNAAAQRIFGYGEHEVLGRHVGMLMPEPHRSQHDAHVRRYLETGEARVIGIGREVVGLKRDGSVFPLDLAVGEVPLGEGKRHFIATLRDITERKRMEAKLLEQEKAIRQAQKMEALGTLAGGIAHDINNTLVPVLGLAGLMQKTLRPDDPQREHVAKIAAAAERMRDLVRQMLTFCRREPPTRRPLDIAAVVGEALPLLRASLPAGVHLRSEIDPATGEVVANPTEIHQVLINLCGNAADAMGRAGGTIAVALRAVADDGGDGPGAPDRPPARHRARLTVADTGPGIESAVLERIFEPFFSTKAPDRGTGMGLSVVHGIVTAYGGAVRASSAPGEGSEFTVELPLHQGREAGADGRAEGGAG